MTERAPHHPTPDAGDVGGWIWGIARFRMARWYRSVDWSVSNVHDLPRTCGSVKVRGIMSLQALDCFANHGEVALDQIASPSIGQERVEVKTRGVFLDESCRFENILKTADDIRRHRTPPAASH